MPLRVTSIICTKLSTLLSMLEAAGLRRAEGIRTLRGAVASWVVVVGWLLWWIAWILLGWILLLLLAVLVETTRLLRGVAVRMLLWWVLVVRVGHGGCGCAGDVDNFRECLDKCLGGRVLEV